MRRNADDDRLRKLERLAATGDRDALSRLFREKQRTGRHNAVTIGEMASTHGPDVVVFMRGLSDELGGSYWKRELDRPPGAILPAMTHEEITRVLSRANYSDARNAYAQMIEANAEDMAARSRGTSRRRPSVSGFMDDARTRAAERVSEFLEEPRTLEPDDIIGHLDRPMMWAIAERIRDVVRESEAEASRGRALGEPPAEVEIEGGVLRRDECWGIRFVDDHGNTEGVIVDPNAEGWAEAASRFGVTRETITVPCPGCGERQVSYGLAMCRECFEQVDHVVSPALARLFRAETDNHEQMLADGDADDETPEPTLGSALESLNSGYDTGHEDDMEAVTTELRGLIALGGEDALIESVWDGDVDE